MGLNGESDYFALAPTRSDPARFVWQEGIRSAFDAPLGAFDLAAPFPTEIIAGMKALDLFSIDDLPPRSGTGPHYYGKDVGKRLSPEASKA